MFVKDCWNKNSPNNQFKHYFYNIVHPSEVQMYTRPQNSDEVLWAQAVANNPDPTTMVPALAVGFEDVKKRVDQQTNMCLAFAKKLDETMTKISEVEKNHHLVTTVRCENAKMKHMDLAHRTLKLMRKLHLLRHRSLSISPEEEVIKQRLETLLTNLRKPSVLTGKLTELYAQIQSIKRATESLGSEGGESGNGNVNGGAGGDLILDDETEEKVFKTLSDHTNAITYLTETLQKDLKEAETMMRGYKEIQVGIVGLKM